MKLLESVSYIAKNEKNELLSALMKKGGSYQWDVGKEESGAPWITAYINDGVWHDIEVSSICAVNDTVEIKGQDYGADGVDIELEHCPTLMLGDYLEILSHIS